ncbi:UNVERIFIED_CONTAM: hypothetical protein Scaly_3035600 [Sesamum calycinum]|uniref:Retrotransposon gag domain-containing protein n=1 Tax=Sesamum calycinum TaxID=2727403 RepID=A0AAW2K8D1_9LAMI
MSHLAEYIEKNLRSPSYASEGDANKSPPFSPRSVSSSSFTTNMAPIMVTNATTIEEQLASLTRAIEGLTKHVQEQNAQIARLINKADNVDANHIKLRVMMKKRIDSLKMPMDYQPPKFQQFDDKDNPKQHVVYFVETYNKAYSIDGWEQLEQEFLNRFYSTRRTVSKVGHAIQDCFVFKDKVMQLACQGKISLEEKSATTNLVSTKCGSLDDEDLFLRSKPHNHSLFMAGYAREQKLNEILIDGGSVVNILPLQTLKELGIPIDELSNGRLDPRF